MTIAGDATAEGVEGAEGGKLLVLPGPPPAPPPVLALVLLDAALDYLATGRAGLAAAPLRALRELLRGESAPTEQSAPAGRPRGMAG